MPQKLIIRAKKAFFRNNTIRYAFCSKFVILSILNKSHFFSKNAFISRKTHFLNGLRNLLPQPRQYRQSRQPGLSLQSCQSRQSWQTKQLWQPWLFRNFWQFWHSWFFDFIGFLHYWYLAICHSWPIWHFWHFSYMVFLANLAFVAFLYFLVFWHFCLFVSFSHFYIFGFQWLFWHADIFQVFSVQDVWILNVFFKKLDARMPAFSIFCLHFSLRKVTSETNNSREFRKRQNWLSKRERWSKWSKTLFQFQPITLQINSIKVPTNQKWWIFDTFWHFPQQCSLGW